MRNVYFLILVGTFIGSGEIGCSTTNVSSFGEKILHVCNTAIKSVSRTQATEFESTLLQNPLTEAIKRGDLEEVQFILQSSAHHEVFKSTNRQALMLAVTQLIDSLGMATATGNTWWYMQVGAGTVSGAAVLLLGWRWSKKEQSKDDKSATESEDGLDGDLPPTKLPKEDKPGHGPVSVRSHHSDSECPISSPNPSPTQNVDRSGAMTPSINSDHSRHVSISQSDSDKSDTKPPVLSSPSAPSDSSSASSSAEEIKAKKKHWWQLKKKKKKKKIESPKDSSDDDEKIRATANTGFFSSIFAKLKGGKKKQLLEAEAETRMAIVQELLNETDCDPTTPDESGLSVLSLVQQTLDQFSSATWQGKLLNDLYQLMQARA